MSPSQYEAAVAALYRAEGYQATVTGGSGDHGIDVIAVKGDERIGIQAKHYAGGVRPVNAQMIRELLGAAAEYGCAKAVLATSGRVLPEASEVARRIGIEIRHLDSEDLHTGLAPAETEFERIWRVHIMPLAGVTLRREGGRGNTIQSVDLSGIARVTSGGNRQRMPIEIFRWTVERLLATGFVARREINEQSALRLSSGVVLILAQAPMFEVVESPEFGLRLVAI